MPSEAGREAVRQSVALVFGLVGTIATVMIVRYATRPDMVRDLSMRCALRGKRLAQHEADRWQAWADWCATRYNEGKA